MRNRCEARCWVIGLVGVLVLGACATGQTNGPAAGSTGGAFISQAVGPVGGTVTAPNGTSVEIPAGALSTVTTVTLTPAPNATPPAQFVWVGAAIGLHLVIGVHNAWDLAAFLITLQ